MSMLGCPILSLHARGRTAGGTRKRSLEADSSGVGYAGGRQCRLEFGESPWIEPMNLACGLRVGQLGIKRNQYLCPLVLCFWVGFLASLPLGLQISMTPMLLGLPFSVILASGSRWSVSPAFSLRVLGGVPAGKEGTRDWGGPSQP